jgi:hypothetical protein
MRADATRRPLLAMQPATSAAEAVQPRSSCRIRPHTGGPPLMANAKVYATNLYLCARKRVLNKDATEQHSGAALPSRATQQRSASSSRSSTWMPSRGELSLDAPEYTCVTPVTLLSAGKTADVLSAALYIAMCCAELCCNCTAPCCALMCCRSITATVQANHCV